MMGGVCILIMDIVLNRGVRESLSERGHLKPDLGLQEALKEGHIPTNLVWKPASKAKRY